MRKANGKPQQDAQQALVVVERRSKNVLCILKNGAHENSSDTQCMSQTSENVQCWRLSESDEALVCCRVFVSCCLSVSSFSLAVRDEVRDVSELFFCPPLPRAYLWNFARDA